MFADNSGPQGPDLTPPDPPWGDLEHVSGSTDLPQTFGRRSRSSESWIKALLVGGAQLPSWFRETHPRIVVCGVMIAALAVNQRWIHRDPVWSSTKTLKLFQRDESNDSGMETILLNYGCAVLPCSGLNTDID